VLLSTVHEVAQKLVAQRHGYGVLNRTIDSQGEVRYNGWRVYAEADIETRISQIGQSGDWRSYDYFEVDIYIQDNIGPNTL